MSLQLVIFGALIMSTMAQRPSFAGNRPASGYKDGFIQQTTSSNSNNNNGDFIGNRNGESPSINTIPNLPIDAHGDAYLFNHYNSLPVDQRPYWLLNQQHIEAQRGTPPRRPSLDNTQIGIGSNQVNGLDFPTRFNTESNMGGFNDFNGQSIRNTPSGIAQQPGVVYPSNITPAQRTDMEIKFLQERLNGLIQIRNQLQQQNQNQLNGGQIIPSNQGRLR